MPRILLLILVFVLPLRAHNCLYLPGDAFFTAMVTFDELKQWKGGPLKLTYHRLVSVTTFCGYLGYREAEITGLTEQQIALLVAAMKQAETAGAHYEHKRDDGTTVKWLRVFIYPRTCDLMTARIGLRYNENWASTQRTFRAKAPVLYDEIGSAASAIHNWELADVVPALPYTTRQEFVGAGMGEEVPLSITAQEVKFVVCPTKDLTAYTDLTGAVRWTEITEVAVERIRPLPGTGKP